MDIEQAYDKIYRYCWQRLRDRHLAEDAAQETFARALAAGAGGGGKGDLRYLYAVARNLCTDEYRRPKPQSLPPDLPAPEGRDGPLTALALRLALDSLPAEEQELVLMRYVNQEPVSLIASFFGMSRFAVYRRTAAALEKLRRALEEES